VPKAGPSGESLPPHVHHGVRVSHSSSETNLDERPLSGRTGDDARQPRTPRLLDSSALCVFQGTLRQSQRGWQQRHTHGRFIPVREVSVDQYVPRQARSGAGASTRQTRERQAARRLRDRSRRRRGGEHEWTQCLFARPHQPGRPLRIRRGTVAPLPRAKRPGTQRGAWLFPSTPIRRSYVKCESALLLSICLARIHALVEVVRR